jgi:hypothetical protein
MTKDSSLAEKSSRKNPSHECPNLMQTDMPYLSLRYLLPKRWWPRPDRRLRR